MHHKKRVSYWFYFYFYFSSSLLFFNSPFFYDPINHSLLSLSTVLPQSLLPLSLFLSPHLHTLPSPKRKVKFDSSQWSKQEVVLPHRNSSQNKYISFGKKVLMLIKNNQHCKFGLGLAYKFYSLKIGEIISF